MAQTNEWYRWNDLATAQAALDAINANENLPLTGRNAKTGQLEPTKQKTTKWCDSVTACTDGKYGFPRIPEARMDSIGITQVERDAWLTAFSPTIETFDRNWIPADPEV